MKRRDFLGVLGGAAAWPLAAWAQQPGQTKKIGILMPLAESDLEARRRIAALTQELGGMGWVLGQTIALEVRYANGKPERLPALAEELVQANVDLIITQAAEPVDAARKATNTIPIIMTSHGDAVGAGIVASLARPGGNITGQTLFATEQGTKRLDLLKQIYPKVVRVAALWNRNAAGHRLQLNGMELAASALGVVLQSLPTRNVDEIDAGLRAAIEGNAQAIVTMDDPFIQTNRARIVELAMRQRLPVISEFRPFTEAGALMSYGPNQIDMWRSAAVYVDKIFWGANPADLPVAQPTKFELVINLKTAKALGLTVPPSLLATADEVIE